MLTLTIQGDELWDDEAEEFTYTTATVLQFEHSLVSLSKWEAKHHKPFLVDDKKSEEEMYDYLIAMLLTPDVPQAVFNRLTEAQILEINDYINDPMTGSTVSEVQKRGPRSSERISAELIYFWMSHYQIPYEAREWHLNQLFTLIKIHHAKNEKPKKMPRHEAAKSMAEENARRRALYNSKG